MRLRVIDLETTGAHPTGSEIIEFGSVDVVNNAGTWQIDPVFSTLFKPTHPLTPETQAVHHLMDEDFPPDLPHVTPELLRQHVKRKPEPDYLVAHHVAFERHFLGPHISGDLPWICTLHCAQKLWPEAPRHTNQVLRYWLRLPLDRKMASPAHRAGPDAYVTAHILKMQLALATPQILFSMTQTRFVRRGAALRAGRAQRKQASLFPTDIA